LTSEPRLKYYKNEKDFRGEIPLESNVRAELINKDTFKLITPSKVYIMKETIPKDAEEWVNTINKAI
jgi:hypothetical protein